MKGGRWTEDGGRRTVYGRRWTGDGEWWTAEIRWAGLVLAVVMVGLLAGCGGAQTGAEPQPPEITYGRDMCDACGMLIDDAHFASATVLSDNSTRKFDDVGEMVAYHMERPSPQVRAWFVHDYGTKNWIRAETAFFVAVVGGQAPMGKGYAAFAQRADAEAMANPLGSKVLTFDELRVQVHLSVHGG